MLSEAIKRARVHILVGNHVKKQHCQSDQHHGDDQISSDADQEQLLNSSNNQQHPYWKLKFLDTFLFFIQMVTSYILMLVVMSFSLYFLLAVVLGQSLGNLVFFYKPKITFLHHQEHQSKDEDAISDHDQPVAAVESAAVEDANVITVEVHHYD